MINDHESRIRDTDMEDEMVRFTKDNILEQGGIAETVAVKNRLKLTALYKSPCYFE